MEPFFDLAHHIDGDDDWDDVTLITHQVYLIKAKPYRQRLLDALCRHGPGILQVR